jgi:5-methyltetrahydropteroyltriglutamate--homocysteine methyltransferase
MEGRTGMSEKRIPFTYDIVGSFLRKPALQAARAAYQEGRISAAELKTEEDRSIRELVEDEKKAGLLAVTDGEYRRAFWHLDFLWNLTGVEKVQAEQFSVAFAGVQPKGETIRITERLDFPEDHPFLDHFRFTQEAAQGTLVKQTIPSPSMLHLICCVREKNYQPIEYYRDEEKLFDDLAETYRKAVKAFYEAGCRYLQFDDTSWGEFCSLDKRRAYAERGIDVDVIGQKYVDVLNRILEVKPADMTITMHICRGNFRSTWSSEGDYEPVAENLFGRCAVDGFFLEYDSERAGGFEPLRFIKDQKVVLGLITSKTPDLEKKEDVIARIHEAEKYLPLEQLSLSPQCGFASTEEGNLLTEEEEWAKVRLVKEIAEEVWG